ncbi:MAG: hypothetical protein HOP07_17685 [Bacteriovoracaceae bacterium]|nr:hypothetical protein [Bacteriovoracaceae bacterium]
MGALKKPVTINNKTVTDNKVDTSAQNNVAKAEIERMKKLLSEKIKDPNLAKKAAMIISEMLNK